MFNAASLGEFHEPLNHVDLFNPNKEVTQNILYIFSLETFLYKAINAASKQQDESKIETLGPFARVLSWIVLAAEKNKTYDIEVLPNTKFTKLYRATTLHESQVDEFEDMKGTRITLTGFISAVRDQDYALSFVLTKDAMNSYSKSRRPVLIMIEWSLSSLYFMFNSPSYSPYYEQEDEVLLYDGLGMKIVDVD